MRIYLPNKVIFTELCSKASVNVTFLGRLIFMSTKIEVLYNFLFMNDNFSTFTFVVGVKDLRTFTQIIACF